MNTKRWAVALGMCGALGLGCGVGMTAGHLLVPRANAQQTQLPKYEYHCVPIATGFSKMDDTELVAHANKLGAQSWEMTTLVGLNLCFRRQLL